MRKIITSCVTIAAVVLFYKDLYHLGIASLEDSLLSHALFIPVVSLYLIWTNRAAIFKNLGHSPVIGAVVMVISLIVLVLSKLQGGTLSQNDALFWSTMSVVLWIWGGFFLVCGRETFIKALFPLLFLSFMIPVPSWALDPVVRFLQMGSTYAAQILLRILDVPAYFEGVHIMLPGASVEVAEECSGIRSALALLILSTVAGYLFLRSKRRRLWFVFFVVPVTLLKNGMRIVTLALLGSYVDISYLKDSALHEFGGKPFLLLAICMMLPVFWVLRRSERKLIGKVTDDKDAIRTDGKLGISEDAHSV